MPCFTSHLKLSRPQTQRTEQGHLLCDPKTGQTTIRRPSSFYPTCSFTTVPRRTYATCTITHISEQLRTWSILVGFVAFVNHSPAWGILAAGAQRCRAREGSRLRDAGALATPSKVIVAEVSKYMVVRWYGPDADAAWLRNGVAHG